MSWLAVETSVLLYLYNWPLPTSVSGRYRQLACLELRRNCVYHCSHFISLWIFMVNWPLLQAVFIFQGLTFAIYTTVVHQASKFVFPADNCKKMGLVFDNVVGIVEIINCKDVKVQVSKHAGSKQTAAFQEAVTDTRISSGSADCSSWTASFILMLLHNASVSHQTQQWQVHLQPSHVIMGCCLFVRRSWVKSPPSPSTKRTVATSTWARTLWTARSSAPRAQRWTSSYPRTTAISWVSFHERHLIDCL